MKSLFEVWDGAHNLELAVKDAFKNYNAVPVLAAIELVGKMAVFMGRGETTKTLKLNKWQSYVSLFFYYYFI